jgi:nitrogen fixation/metabolism regulation signal transduction histidine kinase
MNSSEAASPARPAYKRKVRNYLLDVGLQLRYTATIVIVAVFLTAGLGFKMYQATRDVSKVILWTSLVDPASADELKAQFSNSDRVVLWGIVGFGLVLVLSISAVGILITHKVAGPLHKIANIFGRVRDNRLAPSPASLRKGDELQDFYLAFRDMHAALRERAEEDVRVIGNAISALETSPDARGTTSPLQRTLDDLRALRKRKEESLEPSEPSGLINLRR